MVVWKQKWSTKALYLNLSFIYILDILDKLLCYIDVYNPII